MAKIPRVFQKIFGASGITSDFGQFGSKTAGFPITSKDASTIQALAAFTQNGWPDAINSSNKAPFLEEMNALHFLIFQQLCNIFQDGIPAWDPTTPYFIGSVVRKDGTAELYSSAVNNNVGNALPTQSNNGSWNYINTTSTVPPGAISDFGGSSVPAGWLVCNGASYPVATYPALFSAIGYTWGGSGPNFSVPDLRGRTSIGSGTGSGLSTRSVGQTLGEEGHILSTAEIPSHTHTQNAHHHPPQAGLPNFIAQSSGGALGAFGGVGEAFLNTGDTVATNQNTGGGGSHNNMQPSAVVQKIIKI